MKISRTFRALALLSMITCMSCSEEEMMTVDELACPTIGLDTDHPNHNEYQNILDDLIGEGFPGVTATISDKHGLWLGSAGKADVKNNIGMQICHVGHSGSFAKMYTATAAMILSEKGILDLDAKIEDYLDSELADNLPNGRSATIRQLMNHSAGMPDHDDEEGLSEYGDRNDQHLPSAAEQLAYIFDNEPRNVAGSKSEYSSAHTLTLSLVLDSIYGEHHSKIISKEIINKLGLRETFYKNELGYPTPKNQANGYIDSNEDVTAEANNYASDSQGDAGVISSSHDYYLFLKALMEYQIVSKESVEEMLEPFWWAEIGGQGIGVGLGPLLFKEGEDILKIGHGGITLGGMTNIFYYPKNDAYISLMTNTVTVNNRILHEKWAGNLAINPEGVSVLERLEKVVLEL